MIVFHGDRAVGPELPRLLAQIVPPEHHLTVVFYTRTPPEGIGVHGSYYFAADPPHIRLYLNPIIDTASRHYPGTFAASVWWNLVHVALHEVGHHATWSECGHVSPMEYRMRGRGYWFVEELANRWAARMTSQICGHDPQLAQPVQLAGYLGVRQSRLITNWRRYLDEAKAAPDRYPATGSIVWFLAKELRGITSGGQLAPGEVLRVLEVDTSRYSNAYAELRRLSSDLGVECIDGAGRRHRMYFWGDLSVLKERMATFARLSGRCRHRVEREDCRSCGSPLIARMLKLCRANRVPNDDDVRSLEELDRRYGDRDAGAA